MTANEQQGPMMGLSQGQTEKAFRDVESPDYWKTMADHYSKLAAISDRMVAALKKPRSPDMEQEVGGIFVEFTNHSQAAAQDSVSLAIVSMMMAEQAQQAEVEKATQPKIEIVSR